MSVKSWIEKGSLRGLLRAALAWGLAAMVLSFLAAVIVRAHGIGSEKLGYVSSCLSFLCALTAGAVGGRGMGRLRGGLLCGVFLTLLLLTLGSLIGGGAPDPSGLLSVLSFTLTGCLLGSLLFGGVPAATKGSSFQKKKKQKRYS